MGMEWHTDGCGITGLYAAEAPVGKMVGSGARIERRIRTDLTKLAAVRQTKILLQQTKHVYEKHIWSNPTRCLTVTRAVWM